MNADRLCRGIHRSFSNGFWGRRAYVFVQLPESLFAIQPPKPPAPPPVWEGREAEWVDAWASQTWTAMDPAGNFTQTDVFLIGTDESEVESRERRPRSDFRLIAEQRGRYDLIQGITTVLQTGELVPCPYPEALDAYVDLFRFRDAEFGVVDPRIQSWLRDAAGTSRVSAYNITSSGTGFSFSLKPNPRRVQRFANAIRSLVRWGRKNGYHIKVCVE